MAELPPGESPLRFSPGLKPQGAANRTGWPKQMFLMENDRVGSWLEWKENLSERDYYHPPGRNDNPEGGGTTTSWSWRPRTIWRE